MKNNQAANLVSKLIMSNELSSLSVSVFHQTTGTRLYIILADDADMQAATKIIQEFGGEVTENPDSPFTVSVSKVAAASSQEMEFNPDYWDYILAQNDEDSTNSFETVMDQNTYDMLVEEENQKQ